MPDEKKKSAFLRIFGRRTKKAPLPQFEHPETQELVEASQRMAPEQIIKAVELKKEDFAESFKQGLPVINVPELLKAVRKKFHSDRDYENVLTKCQAVYAAAADPKAESLKALVDDALLTLSKYVVGLTKRNKKEPTPERKSKLEVCSEQEQHLNSILSVIELRIEMETELQVFEATRKVDQLIENGEEKQRMELLLAVGTAAIDGPVAEYAVGRLDELLITKTSDDKEVAKSIVTANLRNGKTDKAGQRRLELLCETALRNDINGCKQPSTILRLTTLGSELAKQYCGSTKGGRKFIGDTCDGTVSRIKSQKKPPELDPHKLGKEFENLNREQQQRILSDNATALRNMVESFLDDIATAKIPPEVARICASIYESTIEKFGDTEESREAAMNAVAGHVVLRMINPRVLLPGGFDPKQKWTPDEQRTASLVTKVLQNIANHTTEIKEEWLQPLAEMSTGEPRRKMEQFLQRTIQEGSEERQVFNLLLNDKSDVKTGLRNRGYAKHVKAPLMKGRSALQQLSTNSPLSEGEVDAFSHLYDELLNRKTHYEKSEAEKGQTEDRDRKLLEITHYTLALESVIDTKITAAFERLGTEEDKEGRRNRRIPQFTKQEQDRNQEKLANILAQRSETDDSVITALIGEMLSDFAQRQEAGGFMRGSSAPIALMKAVGNTRAAEKYIQTATARALKTIIELPPETRIEVDPSKTDVSEQLQQQSVVRIKEMATQILNALDTRSLPPALLKQCYMMYQTYMHKFNDVPKARTLVTGHLFIRFVSPMVTNTIQNLEGTSDNQKRASIILSQVLQAIGNRVALTKEYMLPFNELVENSADKLDEIAQHVITEGQILLPDYTGAPKNQLPRRRVEIQPLEEDTPPEDTPLSARLTNQANATDLLFEMSALQSEGTNFGFDAGKLGEAYRSVAKLVTSGELPGLDEKLRQLKTVLEKCPDRAAALVLKAKLLTPLELVLERRRK